MVSSVRKVIQAKGVCKLPAVNVFSTTRDIQPPKLDLSGRLEINTRLKMDGLQLLGKIPSASIPAAFLDPQYRGVLNQLSYGNEGQSRGKTRAALQQMDDAVIAEFLQGINRALIPTGHVFLWIDKFELLNGFQSWLADTALDVVDLVNWDKDRMGMGYRSRRVTEYCVVLQKQPRRTKGVWKKHDIPDTWKERVEKGAHPHRKPVKLQTALITAVTNEADIVLDPCAGDFTVMEAAQACGRNFLGCDLNG